MAASDPNLYEFELTFKSLYDAKTPVSRSKILSVTDLAIKAQKYYKHVVMHIETFIRKSSPKHKLPGVYVIDSIVRLSQKHYGKERDVFGKRFSKNLAATFANASKCADEDRFKVFRCFKLWKESGFFDDEVLAPILTNIQSIESFEEDGPAKAEKNDENAELNVSSASPSPVKEMIDIESPIKEVKEKTEKDTSPTSRAAEKVRFDKRLLDFDYSDDEEGQSSDRGGKRSKKKDSDDEDYFIMGKNGKPEFSVDKIMMGLRKQRGGSEEASEVEEATEGVPMDVENNDTPAVILPPPSVSIALPLDLPPQTSNIPESTTIILKSCTIWVGHLVKGVIEMDLKRELARYGEIGTFDMIPSRGCAYISYARRSEADAARGSSRDLWKLFGDKVKVSWGAGKGIKDGYKSWDWDSFTGICKIPVEKLPPNARALVEGSELVEESVPNAVKSRFFDQDDSAEKEKLSEPAPLPTAPLPVLPLPVASNISGWQASAAIGFDPKINPWTAFANLTNTSGPHPIVTNLARPPPSVTAGPNGAPGPGARLPVCIPPNLNQLFLPSVHKAPQAPGPFPHNLNVPPPQTVLPVPSLSSSISSLVNALPSAMSALNGPSPLPTSWSDPAPLKPSLQGLNESLNLGNKGTDQGSAAVPNLAQFLTPPLPAGMFASAPTGPTFQRPPPNFRGPLLAPPPDIAARLAMITRMASQNPGNANINPFGKPSDQNGEDNQQHRFKPPFHRADSSPEKLWNNRPPFRQQSPGYNKRFDGPRFDGPRDQRGDRNFQGQGAGRFNGSRPFQRGVNPR